MKIELTDNQFYESKNTTTVAMDIDICFLNSFSNFPKKDNLLLLNNFRVLHTQDRDRNYSEMYWQTKRFHSLSSYGFHYWGSLNRAQVSSEVSLLVSTLQ